MRRSGELVSREPRHRLDGGPAGLLNRLVRELLAARSGFIAEGVGPPPLLAQYAEGVASAGG
jgi:hypothetical protein